MGDSRQVKGVNEPKSKAGKRLFVYNDSIGYTTVHQLIIISTPQLVSLH